MDDLNALERQIEGQLNGFVGPVLPVDDAAIFNDITAASQSTRWGFTMFSALKFIAAGVIVALFGGFLLAGVLTTPQDGEALPAAVTESPSPTTTEELAVDAPTEAVHVSGMAEGPGASRGAGDRRTFFESVTTDHEALDGCYFLEEAGGSEAGLWGTLVVYDGPCRYFGSVEGSQRTWEGEWFIPGQGPGWVLNLHLLTPVWLHGRGPNEGLSAVLIGTGPHDAGDPDAWEPDLEGGDIEVWMFPTPPTWQHPDERGCCAE